MSAGGLNEARLARMHDVLNAYVERGEVPGLIALVSRRGKVSAYVAGKPGFEKSAPLQRDAIFRIASMSKPIIAVATLILIEECRLRLDDPVDRWLPELANRQVLRHLDGPLDETVPAHRSITVRDLLTFRLGFGQLIASPDAYPILKAASDAQIGMGPPLPDSMPEPDEWMRRLGQLPLMHQPGERWLYNTGADVLSVLVARVSGQPLETFLRARIFEPLGMRDTGFSVPETSLSRLADSYSTNYLTGKLEVFDAAATSQWSHPPAFPSGAGGLVSTADDYLAFGQMLLAGGIYNGRRILSRPSVKVMTTDQLTPEQKAVSGLVGDFFDNHGWGFGLSIVTRRDDLSYTPGRFGWDGGLGTSWFDDPEEEMVGILLTQSAWSSPVPPNICRDFWTLAYQAIDD
jgi:CubicO group peptidase (beta-lactamase class C family)